MTEAVVQMIQKAREQLSHMTHLELGSTLSVRKDDRVWHVQVEALEKKSLPDSQDILATYGVTLDEGGNVLDFARTSMRKRSDTALPEGAE